MNIHEQVYTLHLGVDTINTITCLIALHHHLGRCSLHPKRCCGVTINSQQHSNLEQILKAALLLTNLHCCLTVCRPPGVTIGLEFAEYTWRENEFPYLQVCAVATNVAFSLTAELHIINGTGIYYTIQKDRTWSCAPRD